MKFSGIESNFHNGDLNLTYNLDQYVNLDESATLNISLVFSRYMSTKSK